jgi:micrococcal nuclease
MLKKIPLLVFIIVCGAVVGCQLLPANTDKTTNDHTTTWVLRVIDGDTIQVKQHEQTVTLRLACIDAPEREQKPWGSRSTARLKQLLPPGQEVGLKPLYIDEYDRLVAEVFVGDRNINLSMVKEGQAVVYHYFLRNCPEYRNSLLQAEKSAKSQKLGFWNQRRPQMPWDFRRFNRE